jgi:hypothetical protein
MTYDCDPHLDLDAWREKLGIDSYSRQPRATIATVVKFVEKAGLDGIAKKNGRLPSRGVMPMSLLIKPRSRKPSSGEGLMTSMSCRGQSKISGKNERFPSPGIFSVSGPL